MPTVADNIERIQSRIRSAAERAGRLSGDVRLVAVSKTHPVEAILNAYHAGLRHFGENRVEEGRVKISSPDLPPDITWHMIGHIQSRKTTAVAGLFDVVHSVDRLKIARRLSTTSQELGKTLSCLLEVNVSGEESKHGFNLTHWSEDRQRLTAFFADLEQILELPGLHVEGLMTMAPFTTEPETVRPVFKHTADLLKELKQAFPGGDWAHLSMGMSSDYEVAIEEGATIVRIGTAVFGSRSY